MMALEQTLQYRMRQSTEAFSRLVVPHLQTLLPPGQWQIVEGVTAWAMAQTLDMLGGIDAWYYRNNEGIWGVASRVQQGTDNYRTTTLRARKRNGHRTELERLVWAVEHDALHPQWVIHAYATPGYGALLGVGVVPTRPLLQAVAAGIGYERTNREDGTVFRVLPWDALQRFGCAVAEWSRRDSQTSLLL